MYNKKNLRIKYNIVIYSHNEEGALQELSYLVWISIQG